eukprot:NODE_7023_length_477_cov_90.932243_g6214_i0.p1 GENE.NODE_7023_length_477_cov_90.932243_g6214_i0~~NODE_7023_length_477_cov_90.932243_g6214_i0.p1  ORF type:complete len:94 (+),score=29.34 NODE_7023_length_477_cov_90.932243_g6214_i0:26-283(+)
MGIQQAIHLDPDQDQYIKWMFSQCDKDNQGSIDKEGLLSLCSKLGYKMTPKQAGDIMQSINPRRDRVDYRGFILWWTTGKSAEAY